MVKLKFTNKAHARFKLQVRNEQGEITKETDWFDNLVLNQGLNLMATRNWFNMCMVGSGNSTPLVTQTALDSSINWTTTLVADVQGAASSAPYYKWQRKTFRFAAGNATGNISEVAIGGREYISSWVNTIWNRALIKDANGNPTTVTVLSTETLDVVTEVRMYIDPTEVTGTIDFGAGVVRNFTLKPMLINAMSASAAGALGGPLAISFTKCFTGGIGAVTGQPSGALGSNANSFTKEAYVSDSFKFKTTSKFNQGNATGNIKSMSFEFSNAIFYQMEFDSAITKSSTHELSITTELSWGRYP